MSDNVPSGTAESRVPAERTEHCVGDLCRYTLGFKISLALSAASFFVALAAGLSPLVTGCALGALGIIQVVVQLRFFMHIDGKRENQEDLLLVLFSTLVLLIVVVGTIWILGNLESQMMGKMTMDK